MPSVVILTPSRGLLHSRTVEAVLDALRAARGVMAECAGWLISHDLPIPDCHETLAFRGLAETDADLLWFVEEDMVPPADALVRLIACQQATGAGIVLLDYPVGEHPTRSTITRAPDDGRTILYGGLGCTLITRTALATIPRPWFDTSRLWRLANGRLELLGDGIPARYGGQDVALCVKAAEHGVGIAAVADGGATAGHARLRQLGAAGTNQGTHTIDLLTRIEAEAY